MRQVYKLLRAYLGHNSYCHSPSWSRRLISANGEQFGLARILKVMGAAPSCCEPHQIFQGIASLESIHCTSTITKALGGLTEHSCWTKHSGWCWHTMFHRKISAQFSTAWKTLQSCQNTCNKMGKGSSLQDKKYHFHASLLAGARSKDFGFEGQSLKNQAANL